MRRSLHANVPDIDPATDIPYPGLAEPHSQLAVPVLSAGSAAGRAVPGESTQALQFSYEDEDMHGGRWPATWARRMDADAGQYRRAGGGHAGRRRRSPPPQAMTGATGPSYRCAAFHRQRQRVHQRHLPHQGCGWRHFVEAAEATSPSTGAPNSRNRELRLDGFASACPTWPTTWKHAWCCCSAAWWSTARISVSKRPGAGASAWRCCVPWRWWTP
jgi:hypothetical protein